MTAKQLHFATKDLDAVRSAVSVLHVSNWAAVEPLLRIRARPDVGANGQGLNDLRLEVVLQVEHQTASGSSVPDRRVGVVPLNRLPWRSWPVLPKQIWQAAAANTRKSVRPTVTSVAAPPFHIWFLTGEGTTSGVAMDAGYFIRAGASRGAEGDTGGRGWFSVLSNDAAVLISMTEVYQIRGAAASLAAAEHRPAALKIIAELRRRTDRPFPPNLLRYPYVQRGSQCEPA